MDKQKFVRELAEFLAGDAVEMGIKLKMGRTEAKKWADLRLATPLFGYQTVDEAEAVLREWLGVGKGDS
jgi:hypothetical protein